MTSIIKGYEYDIFISYRQNDNKHDGWVTEFVKNLRGELESTFKESVSIYFDENPHDRLLETHIVDKSLEDKLKSFIFIPVISQTYCDPKCYAWQHELLPFLKMCEEDQFGRDIKLRNGNVASRILPVRIHDLDPVDVRLFENVTKSAMRGMDFVFKTSSGVNRPLRVSEDHPNDNLNKTYYLDQINKVANAISEIYRGLNHARSSSSNGKAKEDQLSFNIEKDLGRESSREKKVSKKSIKMLVIISLVLLFLAGVFGVFKLLKQGERNNQLPAIEKSIAVLPFVNDSPDEQNAYFINGIMEEILNNLQKIRDLRVLSRTSTEGFRGNAKPTLPEIAKKIGVNYIIEGSGQKYGNKFVLRVQLIAAKNEKHLWGKSYDRDIQATSDIISVQTEIAQAIAKELKAIMTPEEKQIIGKTPTMNLTAYDFYLRGNEISLNMPIGSINREVTKKAEFFYKKALEYDSTFALAYAGLAGLYWGKNSFEENTSKNLLDSMLVLANIALSYDDQLAEAYIMRAGYYAEKGGDLKKALEELDKSIKINPNQWEAYYEKAKYYEWEGDIVREIENRQKAASLNHGSKLPELLDIIASSYFEAGFPEKAKEYCMEALTLTGDSSEYLNHLVEYETITGNFKKAQKFLVRISNIDSAKTDLDLEFGLNFMFLGQYEESLQYLKKWMGQIEASRVRPTYSIMNLIGFVYWKNGFKKEADYYFNKHIEFCNNLVKTHTLDQSGRFLGYANLDLAGIYAFRGEKDKAFESLKIFNQMKSFTYGDIMRIKYDPLTSNIRNEPDFKKIERDVEVKYQAEHERVSKWLAEHGNL